MDGWKTLLGSWWIPPSFYRGGIAGRSHIGTRWPSLTAALWAFWTVLSCIRTELIVLFIITVNKVAWRHTKKKTYANSVFDTCKSYSKWSKQLVKQWSQLRDGLIWCTMTTATTCMKSTKWCGALFLLKGVRHMLSLSCQLKGVLKHFNCLVEKHILTLPWAAHSNFVAMHNSVYK